MKNKIVGIFVCMLVIATAVPTVESFNNTVKDVKIRNHQIISTTVNWTEKQKLFASDGDLGDAFSCFVFISQDTALIGAFWDDDNGDGSGSAFIFTYNGVNWSQQAKLLASDGQAGDNLGSSVFLDGDTAIVGAMYDDDNGVDSGSAFVFTRSGNSWSQQAKLRASDGNAGDMFGRSVSASGDTAIVGAPNNKGVGAAFVYTRSGNVWSQQAKLTASDGGQGDGFMSVAIDGDTAIVGAIYDDDLGIDSGSAYIFTRTGNTWTQQAKLLASDGDEGDGFGWSVHIKGDTAVVGAGGSCSAYVFTRNGSTWTQQAKLKPSDINVGDHFGVTVSISGNSILIGAPYHDDSGSAYVFTNSGNSWIQEAELLPSDGSYGDWFGYSVSLYGDTALINSPFKNGTGAAYIFQKTQAVKTFMFGRYANFTSEEGFITVDAISLWTVQFKPFKLFRHIAPEKIKFADDYVGLKTKGFLIGVFTIV